MKFGAKYLALKRKSKETSKTIKINREHIVHALEEYLVSRALWDQDKEITNIQFSDLFGVSDVEIVTLKIMYEKGGKR